MAQCGRRSTFAPPDFRVAASISPFDNPTFDREQPAKLAYKLRAYIIVRGLRLREADLLQTGL